MCNHPRGGQAFTRASVLPGTVQPLMFFHLKLRAGGPCPSLAKPKPSFSDTVENHVSAECWKEGVIVLSCPAERQEAGSEPQQPGALTLT